MPLINSPTLIRSFALVHLTIASYLLTDPAKIVHHNFVTVLGASMGLPPTPSALPTSTSTPIIPLAAAFLSLLSLTDLVATTLPEEIYSYYWSSQTPVRLLFFFVVTFISYVSKPGGMSTRGRAGAGNVGGAGAGWMGLGTLSNGLVFTWAFVQMVWWFWVYVTLRDERREMSARKGAERERRREEDGMLRL